MRPKVSELNLQWIEPELFPGRWTVRKQIIEYTSPLDALIALAKQLNTYEYRYQMDSADFFAQYSQGQTSDDEDFVEWAGSYRHYLDLHQELESKLNNAA